MAIRKKLATGDEIKPVELQTPEALEDAVKSAAIIEERSNGLVNFIERYKKLTALPPLKLIKFPAGDLFTKVEQLYMEELNDLAIQLNCQSDCSYELEADRQLLEQVLINLMKNSVEAVRNTQDPKIELSCYRDADNHTCLSIRDNGEGIPPDKLEQVFVPFFTTRKDGSGIGLSLCKQIIRLHKGRIHMESTPNEGSNVIIKL